MIADMLAVAVALAQSPLVLFLVLVGALAGAGCLLRLAVAR